MSYPRIHNRRTKIVCTIGPATGTEAGAQGLVRAGMDIARLNLSHGDHGTHAGYVQSIRTAAGRLGTRAGILMDIPGPKYRVGKLEGGQATLAKGNRVVLTSRQVEGNAALVPVNPPSLPQAIRPGDTVLLDDGAVRLRAEDIAGGEVVCLVVDGGVLVQGRGVVMPGMRTAGPFVTDSLREHLLFAIGQQPDYLAVSFVSSAEDVEQVKAIIYENGLQIPVVAKIEKKQAVSAFEGILAASDGIMVARGDLGVDIPLERVPTVQKEIIRRCNQVGKPVITATQMLESMVNAPRPTRAEATDVANAIFDGTDATMLSAETSIGKYPMRSVRMMAKIAREAERRLHYEDMLKERNNWLGHETAELISYDACHIAHRLGAAAIVAVTQSGGTAGRVSKYRPKAPVLAITPSDAVCGRLLLRWGVYPYLTADLSSVEELFATASGLARELGLAERGDLIVITGGIPVGVSGSTNLLKVEKIR